MLRLLEVYHVDYYYFNSNSLHGNYKQMSLATRHYNEIRRPRKVRASWLDSSGWHCTDRATSYPNFASWMRYALLRMKFMFLIVKDRFFFFISQSIKILLMNFNLRKKNLATLTFTRTTFNHGNYWTAPYKRSVRTRALWQYGLWSFQAGGTTLERFLPKNQHTQRKLLNFENWVNGEVSKSAKIWASKSIFYVKNHRNISQFFYIKNQNNQLYKLWFL